MRNYRVRMQVRNPSDGGLRWHEGTVRATNTLNAVGHAILRFGIKTDDVLRLEVAQHDAAPDPADASHPPGSPETEDTTGPLR